LSSKIEKISETHPSGEGDFGASLSAPSASRSRDQSSSPANLFLNLGTSVHWVSMEMLMQPWKPESESDGINSGSWYHCLPIKIYHWLGEEGYIAVVCDVVCYAKVRPGLSGKKMRWHFSEQRWEWSDGCV